MKSKMQVRHMVVGAIVGALYVVLTLFSSLMGLSSGVIQVRFSEALCILPLFTPAAIPGIAIGCFISNVLTGAVVWDVLLGTFASLLGAIGTYLFRKKPFLGFLSPILSNTLLIPFVLKYAYGFAQGIPYFMLTVFLGEVLSVGFIGSGLFLFIQKNKKLRNNLLP